MQAAAAGRGTQILAPSPSTAAGGCRRARRGKLRDQSGGSAKSKSEREWGGGMPMRARKDAPLAGESDAAAGGAATGGAHSSAAGSRLRTAAHRARPLARRPRLREATFGGAGQLRRDTGIGRRPTALPASGDYLCIRADGTRLLRVGAHAIVGAPSWRPTCSRRLLPSLPASRSWALPAAHRCPSATLRWTMRDSPSMQRAAIRRSPCMPRLSSTRRRRHCARRRSCRHRRALRRGPPARPARQGTGGHGRRTWPACAASRRRSMRSARRPMRASRRM